MAGPKYLEAHPNVDELRQRYRRKDVHERIRWQVLWLLALGPALDASYAAVKAATLDVSV